MNHNSSNVTSLNQLLYSVGLNLKIMNLEDIDFCVRPPFIDGKASGYRFSFWEKKRDLSMVLVT